MNEHEHPAIKVGDKVKFECGDLDNEGPRWQFNDDLGPSGIWVSGEIVYVDNKVIQVRYLVPNMHCSTTCTWPNEDHPDYDPMQWWQDGYLTWIVETDKPECECGAEKANTTHSTWCPKRQRLSCANITILN